MELFADRFAMHDNDAAIDLATGRRVALRRFDNADGVDRSDQIRWSLRCDHWLSIHHRSVARLIDYGLAGRNARFEAWDGESPWEGSDDEAARTRALATRFLAAAGLTAGVAMTIHARDGVAVAVPGDEDGYERAGEIEPEAPIAVRGLRRIPRGAVTALTELFDDPGDRRGPAASLWGEAGAGTRVVVQELTRAARLKGFVPVASRMLGTPYASLWQGRALFVIHDERHCDGAPWRAVLRSTLETPLPHAVLIVGRHEDRAVDGIGLPAVSVDDLMAAVLPPQLTPRLEERVRRAAVESMGRPGRFAKLLWPDWTGERTRPRHGGSRAAERAASYGVDGGERATGLAGETAAAGSWASPCELATLRSRVIAARADLAAGRHAPALRALRQAASAFARRDAWGDAAAAGLATAAALLARGRAREALLALDDVRGDADRCGDEATILDVAILSGEARVDAMRFGEAEQILAAAVATAMNAQDAVRATAAGVALARCLFWRGKYLDAARALDRCGDGASHALRIRRTRLLARVHVGLGDLEAALASVAALKRDGEGASDHGVRAAIDCTAAFVYLRVGDLDAAAREARAGVAAARAAHDPLRAVRARLLLIEAERRRDRLTTIGRQLERLKRLRDTVPPIVRARCDLLLRLSDGDGRGAAPEGALALFAPADAAAGRTDPAIDDVIVILRACQTAEDEAVVLKDVCAHVRGQLRAIAAAFVVRAERGCEVFVFDGGRVDLEMAERAMTAGIVIRPHRYGDRIGGAAPVLFGGSAAGALCARWSIGSEYDPDRAGSVLAMAATAAAPMLAAALAHRRTALPEGAALAPLLGVTPAMGELRHAAQRAGAAPFGVLVVGESGSGKELVARAIHRSSPRRDGPFCALNCAALPDDLVESELFGHARGAFTGAVADRPGVFEEAHGGTLFLDEIGELSPRAQAKILRVIQEGELRRVGENIPRRVDARVIAATNRDLAREVESGRFRLDLLYRLDVVRITVPPLRERADDIGVLAAHFWTDATARINSRATLAPATIGALARYSWPGNVRELQNVLAALAVRCPRRGLVPPTALPSQFGTARTGEDNWRLDDARRTFEERFVRAALVRTGGHRTRAAAELGVSRQGFTKLLARLGISDGL
ncbi:MAG TPA: sigma 54-interacting transcriptional regulator [Vicinamibacterales bacterium]|nr:sigma 54-interacting transcriptional regulator [Vicinamibacterales bacterium]